MRYKFSKVTSLFNLTCEMTKKLFLANATNTFKSHLATKSSIQIAEGADFSEMTKKPTAENFHHSIANKRFCMRAFFSCLKKIFSNVSCVVMRCSKFSNKLFCEKFYWPNCKKDD